MKDSFHVAVAAPVLTEPLRGYLDGGGESLPAGVGGSSSLVCQLIGDLLDRGRRVSVVALDESVGTPLAAGGPLLDVAFGPYRARHRMRDLMRGERHAVRDGILRVQPDLVHAHWCCEYALGALASGLPTLITVHDWMPAILRLTERRYWPYWSGRTLLYFTTLARAGHLAANSPYTAHKVRPFTRASLEVIPNGVPDGVFVKSPDLSAPVWQQPDRRPVVISVNNGFGPRKNVQRLIQAYGALQQQGRGCELHLIGDGYEPGGPCESWARQSKLAQGITFVGPRGHDEILRRMREATLLMHPALEESFGLTLIEAMSQRLPVIAGASSGAVPWVLGGGRAGLLVDVTDPRSIARAIEAVLTQDTLRQRLADDGMTHAWRAFRQSHVTDLYLDAYRRVLADAVR